jgi:hypothetical protein
MTAKDSDLLAELLREGQAGIAWAATPKAKAQYAAALDVAQRLKVPVTPSALTAILWAAHSAKPPDDPGDGRTRTHRELRFNAEGSNDGELPASFRLELFETPQARDGRRFDGYVATGPAARTVLAEGISRRDLEALLGKGISWLAWDGTN